MSLLGAITPAAMKRRMRWLGMSKLERRNHGYDLDTVRVLGTLAADANCVDVGAANGKILKRMITAAPRGRHHAFEARPDAAAKLRERYPSVTVHPIALGNESGMVRFHQVPAFPGRSGLRRQHYPGAAEVEDISVPIARLDDVLPEEQRIDFIKIDVEGAEYLVLRGADRICRRDRPTIVFEYGTAGRDHYGVTPQMMYDLLAGYGLRPYRLDDWLRGRPPLDREHFEAETRRHWYFLAHESPVHSGTGGSRSRQG